jgi:hypothetical protein
MKKKIILIVVAVLIVLIGALAALPFIYKDAILAKVKRTLNEQVEATINFSDLEISVFRHFPKAELALKDLTVTGKGPFAGDTLLAVKTIATNVSLTDLIRKDFIIKELTIDQPSLKLLALKTGEVNWDIAKPSTGPAAPESASAESKPLEIDINDIRVNGLNLLYQDDSFPMTIQALNSNFSSTGKVVGTLTHFDMQGTVDEFVLEYDSVKYISKTKLKASTQLSVDYNKMDFTFQNGKLWLNELPLTVAGTFSMPNDSMLFDLSFAAEKSDFATLLAMVPGDYQPYLEKVDAKGSAELKGSFKGLYYNETYPAFDLVIGIDNATFQYKDLPEKISDINLSATISKPEGPMELLKIAIDKAHARVKNNPVDARLLVTDAMTDPNIDGTFAGTIDFTSLKQALPLDSLDLSGILKASLSMSGRLSAIEKYDFSNFKSNGQMTLSNVKVSGKQLTKPVEISSGQLDITTPQIKLANLKAKVGQSDFALQGTLNDYLPYFFSNGTLKGSFNLTSDFMNFNELTSLQAQSPEKQAAPADSVLAFKVPAKLDLSFKSDIKKAQFDKLNISNIDGLIKVKDERMELTNLNMDMLNGHMALNGSYKNNAENRPDFDFKLNITKFDIPSAYQSISTVKSYLPIASRSQGTFSTQIGFSGKMNEKLSLMPASLNGSGLFNTQNLAIIDSPTFEQIKGFIKKEKLKNVKVNDFTANFTIDNGRLALKPFQTMIADQQATISGSVSPSADIALNLDFLVNRDDLSADINKGLGILPGSQNIQKLDVSVIVSGPLKKPDVKIDLSKAKAQIEEEVKKASMEEIKDSAKKLGKELKKLLK